MIMEYEGCFRSSNLTILDATGGVSLQKPAVSRDDPKAYLTVCDTGQNRILGDELWCIINKIDPLEDPKS